MVAMVSTSDSASRGGAWMDPVRLGRIAHGGHCVARVAGRVVFVRHGIPGELVRIALTDTSRPRFWWAEVSEVLEPAADRAVPPCPVAGLCGGCDFQHVGLARQRVLKAQVIAEQLHRLAGIDHPVVVEPVPGDLTGQDYRTRMRFLVREGRVGLRGWRSDGLVVLPAMGCRIAHPAARRALRDLMLPDGEIRVAVGSDAVSVLGQAAVPLLGPELLTQQVTGRRYSVRAAGFWQAHSGAAELLARTVIEMLAPRVGDRALDLYCGAGLFAGALADAGCLVTGIEAEPTAVELARRNVPSARFHAGRLAQLLGRLPGCTDLIVLDPPRAGAGERVSRRLAGLGARRICYVACDPAALARDLATFASAGYRLVELRAFDLFPMTHHVETVVLMSRV